MNGIKRGIGVGQALQMEGRVILALILRDIKTRMGGSYFGFLLGLILPLGHIAVVTIAYVVMGRRPAIGTDVVLFLSSAILLFIVWSYTHQKIIAALGQNLPLTSFPIVKMIDIIIARAAVEMIASTMVCVVSITAIAIYGSDLFVKDPPTLIFSVLLAYALGVATGFLFGLLAMINYSFGLIGYLIIPLFWIASGVFFIPDALPEAVRYYLSFFALAHIVDMARSAIFPSYVSYFADTTFVVAAIVANVVICLLAIRFFRAQLTGH